MFCEIDGWVLGNAVWGAGAGAVLVVPVQAHVCEIDGARGVAVWGCW